MNINELYIYFLECEDISTDSRSVKKNSLFFALKGDNFDGNKYALEALNKGAKYAIIDDSNLKNPNFIKVQNVLNSLQELSTFHRIQLSKTKIIALTGSNGKTTTKELIHSVLSKKYKTVSTLGNLNNHIGVPISLLKIKKDSNFAVIEMGANHIGEIAFLTNLVKPDYGYITNFGKAHLEGFGGIKGVIKGKTELYNWLIENKKPILINSDDKIQKKFTNSKSILFGKKIQSQFVFKEFNEDFVSVGYNEHNIKSKLIGGYNFSNIIAAISFGLYFKIDIKSIQNAIENYTPKNNRSEVLNTKDKKIILDAYNANPTSMRLAIDSFFKLSGSKALILADMLELGVYSNDEHLEIINHLEKENTGKTYLVGEEFYKLKKESNSISFYKTKNELILEISNNKILEKNILIKGSRAMKMEELINLI
ncbi:MAG: UDP-N-acetylmuramoyl-tripeptide--D-alanyl-D-alanine ligase [Flavobacteriaceae bacterium]|jgi:UDP-N-acetylmuramoyl-tripeptide--D-alanyl-D-alanine ligase|nr:UDP-N-acetylmuramoyl-tripeptide--D-alanyl-D-alanine ligase [Flavobacteriaceae bacterium]MBT3794462.1 UDP-N-acetylmuramoyl-tripeptide--D-alanyl-D-alanine ligase [Flavobacteriaceae bacterium]MBT6688495.1 UDP-N-acetylmuramoyl-tripeptide--D-alanyl-D-alanine ligase [Flavobacteriaceae bacterium]MBT7010601.1 UDP-N-acetylmuramoyl-tripeptide--D-alanyl-D-alanine ligase [Flavobacteriaceae bacterium]MBT7319846.1 UDP-N-acetylmuramoyl-tripeptide--D-alanyl-D-alanine ligase [Flavobacteriaceae bacterium]